QVLELLGCIPALLLLLLSCSLDHVLVSVLSVIQHHSFVQYSLRSSHHLSVQVSGSSLLAQLLRSTVGALNTSSDTQLETSNLACLPQPRSMTPQQYASSCMPVAVLVLLCLVQVYSYRMRRAIAAFFFPKREKMRVLHLYNKLLRQRRSFVQRQRKLLARRALQQQGLVMLLLQWCCRHLPCMLRWMRQSCIICGTAETPWDQLCPLPACGARYCKACW
ncbi:DCST1 ligase, partial [Upupa epops]|nr:DCST1 ligase [Upupa epops]